MNRSTDCLLMPLNRSVGENRKSALILMAFSAVLTLFALVLLGAFNPKAMLIVGGVAFVALAVRFVWLVWRELH